MHVCVCVCVYALQNELQNTKCVYSQCSFCACKCTTGYRGAGWSSTVDGYVKALKHFIICAKAHTHTHTHARRDRHRARLCTHIESINKSLSKNCKCRLKCITHMLTQTRTHTHTHTAQTKWQKYLKLLLCCPVALLVCCSVACHTHTHTHSACCQNVARSKQS